MVTCVLLFSYLSVFGSDYTKAVEFNKKHHDKFLSQARLHKIDERTLKTIVFPELVRYSFLSDLIETEALEQLYVNGIADVDFSIGHFQMKPSFAEQVEKYITDHQLPGFDHLVKYATSNHRKERMARLKTTEGQLGYLCGFVKIVEHRFAAVVFASEEEKLKFMCTAYNSGFMNTECRLRQRLSEKSFPYGPNVKMQQYNYADIALDYYLTVLKKEKP